MAITTSIPGVYTEDNDEADRRLPTQIIPTIELPVYGVRPVDRKWWIDQFVCELDNGQFANAARLGDAMKRNSRIMGALEQRQSGLFSAPLELEPANPNKGKVDKATGKSTPPSRLAIKVRDEIKANWELMFPRAALEEMHQYMIMQGIVIAEKRWNTSTRPWTFTIDVRHPQFYLWLWNTGCYHLITLNQSLVKVPRRSTQWITIAPYGYKRAFLNGRIRALVDAWMMSAWNKNDWAHYNEMYGKMIKKAIVPQQSDPAQEKEFVNAIANMGNNTTIKTRQDKDGNKYDVELIEAKSRGWDTFEAMRNGCNEEIAEVLLGQTASMDSQGGLNSQENPGAGVRSDIKASDNNKLCEALYTQALREYCEFNYGDADLAPYPCYQVSPPEDQSKVADTDQKTGQALVAFKGAGAPVNVREYLEQRGYPLLTPQEEAEQKQAAMETAQQMAALTRPQDGNDTQDKKPNDKQQ